MRMWLLVVQLCVALPAQALSGFEVSSSPTDKPNSYTVTLRGVLDAPPAAVRHVVLRPCEFRKRYKYIDECVLWKTEGNTAWGYTLLDLPVLDPRDYIAVRTVEQDLNPDGTGSMTLRFVEDHTVGPQRRKGVIRVEVNQGVYMMSPVDGGTRTLVTYTLTCSPGGVVPLWLAKIAAKRAGPETLERIEKVAREVHQQKTVQLPVAGAPWAGVKTEMPTLPMITAAPAAAMTTEK